MKKLYCALLAACCLIGLVQAGEESKSERSLPAPEKREVKFGELKAKMVDLDGKVVKTTINEVFNFEQTQKGKYKAWCGYYAGTASSKEWVTFPEEGKEIFEELAKKSSWSDGGGKTIYLHVRGKNLEAVGSRYRKDKDEYSW